MTVRIYSAYDTPPKVILDSWPESMTRQSEAEAVDINNIVKRYHATGILPPMRDSGIYADVTQMGDYRQALEQVALAKELFMELPADVRAEFQNSPALFLDFVSNPENAEALQEMGLVKGPEVTEPEAPEKDPGSGSEGSQESS